MEEFRKHKFFIEAVESQDIFRIKSDLESLIAVLNGDREECLKAIEYAINNSGFNWEIDDGRFFGKNINTDREMYLYEKERLVQNFTKERFEKVISLYNKLYPNVKMENGGVAEATPSTNKKTEQNKTTSSTQRTTNQGTTQSSKRIQNNNRRRVRREEENNIPLVLIGIIGIIILGFILKIILD